MESDLDSRLSQVEDTRMQEKVLQTENVSEEGDSYFSDTVHQVESELVEVHSSEDSNKDDEQDKLDDVSPDHYHNLEYDDLSSAQVLELEDNVDITEKEIDIHLDNTEAALGETNKEMFDDIHEIKENTLSQDDEEDLVQAQEDAFADVTALDDDEDNNDNDDATDYYEVTKDTLKDGLVLTKEENTENETIPQTDGDESIAGTNDDIYSYDLNDFATSPSHENADKSDIKSEHLNENESSNSHNDTDNVGYLHESVYDGYDVSDPGNNEEVHAWYAPMDEEETKGDLEETQDENAELKEIREEDTTPPMNAIDDSSDDINYPSGSDSTAFDRMDLADAYDDDESTIDDIDSMNQEEESKALDQFTPSRPTVPPMNRDCSPTVEYMITQNMRRVLIRDLGYTSQEINNMKPDVATVIVSKMLKRPKSGMPTAFYVDGTVLSDPQTKRWGLDQRALLRRTIFPGLIVVATVGIGILAGATNNDVMVARDEIGSHTSTDIPPIEDDKICASTVGSSRPALKLSEGTTFASNGSEEKDFDMLEKETVNLKDRDLDKTWLDRAISTVLEKLDEARKRPF